jgi:hypothetical protein
MDLEFLNSSLLQKLKPIDYSIQEQLLNKIIYSFFKD